MLISIDFTIFMIIMFGSSVFGAIIASIALMRYLQKIEALDTDAINKHRQEVSKSAGSKIKSLRKHK